MTSDDPRIELMRRFKRAFAKGSADELGEVLTADFEWHTHTFDPDSPESTGRILRGVDGVVAEIERRRRDWSDVQFVDMVEHYAPELVTQSFTISGVDRGTPFERRAVDLYLVADGRIARKDTYWKQPATG